MKSILNVFYLFTVIKFSLITISFIYLGIILMIAINDSLPNRFFHFNHPRVKEIRCYDFLFRWTHVMCIHCNGNTEYLKHSIFGLQGWNGNIICYKCR
jgi:hypothetical protein